MGNQSGAMVRQWAMALLLAAVGQAGMLGSVQAMSLDTTSATPNDGVLQNFTGINWNGNGAGWVQGFDLTGANTTGDTDTFTVTYQAFAGSIQSTSPTPNLYVASPGSATGGYELTTLQFANETATCMNLGCSSVSLALNSGSWSVWFDSAPDANQATGTGFTDGVLILAGMWGAGSGTFSGTTGNSTLNGLVNFFDAGYFPTGPLLTNLQMNSLDYPGLGPPLFTRPASINGVSTGPDTATDFIVQVDPLQRFSVPEPSTLALAVIGILAMGRGFRRA